MRPSVSASSPDHSVVSLCQCCVAFVAGWHSVVWTLACPRFSAAVPRSCCEHHGQVSAWPCFQSWACHWERNFSVKVLNPRDPQLRPGMRLPWADPALPHCSFFPHPDPLASRPRTHCLHKGPLSPSLSAFRGTRAKCTSSPLPCFLPLASTSIRAFAVCLSSGPAFSCWSWVLTQRRAFLLLLVAVIASSDLACDSRS